MIDRPTWPETWMGVAERISERSYDTRLKVGSIIVSADNTCVLSVGYNGNAKGLPNVAESLEPGHSGFLHSELNACIKADFSFPKPKHMYCTHSTCPACAKILINFGIARFVYDTLYRDASGLDLLRQGGVEVMTLDEAILTAKR
jgi:dCMP deaminase